MTTAAMRIDVVTIFPDYLAPLELSLIGKAREQGLLDVRVHDLREHTHDRHRTVDDTPYGGGAGMVMRPEPWGRPSTLSSPPGAAPCPACSSPPHPVCRSPRPSPATSPPSRGWPSPAVATRASTSGSSSMPRG